MTLVPQATGIRLLALCRISKRTSGRFLASFRFVSSVYVCVIKFQLDSDIIKKYVEPTLYCQSMILTLFPGISFWKTGLINPQPYEPYCFVGSYPFGCAGDCIRGGDSEGPRKMILTFALRYYLFLVIVLGLLIVGMSMAIILVSIRRKERAVLTTTRLMNDNKTSNVLTVQQRPHAPQPFGISRNCDGSFCPSGEGKDLDTEMTYSTPALERAQSIRRKKITFQACMYILAFLLTWVFPVLTFCIRRSIVIAVFKMIFQPSQGFFNAIIFVYHKVNNFQEAYPRYSFFEATWKVLRHPEEVPDTMVKGCELLHLKSLFGSSPDDGSLVADEEKSPAGFSRNMIIPEEVDAGARKALNDNAFAIFNERLEKKKDENSIDSLLSSLRQHRSVDGRSTRRSSQDVIDYRYYN